MEENYQGKLLRRQLSEVLELNEGLIDRIEQLKLYILRSGYEVPAPGSGMNAPIVELAEFRDSRAVKRRRTYGTNYEDASTPTQSNNNGTNASLREEATATRGGAGRDLGELTRNSNGNDNYSMNEFINVNMTRNAFPPVIDNESFAHEGFPLEGLTGEFASSRQDTTLARQQSLSARQQSEEVQPSGPPQRRTGPERFSKHEEEEQHEEEEEIQYEAQPAQYQDEHEQNHSEEEESLQEEKSRKEGLRPDAQEQDPQDYQQELDQQQMEEQYQQYNGQFDGQFDNDSQHNDESGFSERSVGTEQQHQQAPQQVPQQENEQELGSQHQQQPEQAYEQELEQEQEQTQEQEQEQMPEKRPVQRPVQRPEQVQHEREVSVSKVGVSPSGKSTPSRSLHNTTFSRTDIDIATGVKPPIYKQPARGTPAQTSSALNSPRSTPRSMSRASPREANSRNTPFSQPNDSRSVTPNKLANLDDDRVQINHSVASAPNASPPSRYTERANVTMPPAMDGLKRVFNTALNSNPHQSTPTRFQQGFRQLNESQVTDANSLSDVQRSTPRHRDILPKPSPGPAQNSDSEAPREASRISQDFREKESRYSLSHIDGILGNKSREPTPAQPPKPSPSPERSDILRMRSDGRRARKYDRSDILLENSVKASPSQSSFLGHASGPSQKYSANVSETRQSDTSRVSQVGGNQPSHANTSRQASVSRPADVSQRARRESSRAGSANTSRASHNTNARFTPQATSPAVTSTPSATRNSNRESDTASYNTTSQMFFTATDSLLSPSGRSQHSGNDNSIKFSLDYPSNTADNAGNTTGNTTGNNTSTVTLSTFRPSTANNSTANNSAANNSAGSSSANNSAAHNSTANLSAHNSTTNTSAGKSEVSSNANDSIAKGYSNVRDLPGSWPAEPSKSAGSESRVSLPRRKKLARNVYEVDIDASLPDMSDMSVNPGEISEIRGRPNLN